MAFKRIDDFCSVPMAQTDYQKVSFVLCTLGLEIQQGILSKKTIDLILSSVSEGPTGSYSFLEESRDALCEAIGQDVLRHATSHTHARDVIAQMGI